MSALGRLFGGGKKNQPSVREAIARLKDTESMLVKKSDFLEKKVQDELSSAKSYGTKNKRMALAHLKKKKRYEKQLNQVDGTLSNIEFQIQALEDSTTNTEVFKNMQYSTSALKKAHGNMTADEIHDVMDDISEQQDVAQEISDALSTSVGYGADIDEDDLLAELEELEQEDLDKELLDVGVAPSLPDVPTASLPAAPAKKEEDDEMAELQNWMTS